MAKFVSVGDVLLGKYTVERVLGQGGMGIVVAARHTELQELFAIKLMRAEAASNQEAAVRFLREARSAARLKSDHVARVHDVGRLENGAPYMVMEHLTGRDLKEHLKARGPLPLHEAVTYVLEACEAVAEAHSLGIVHRDLKPANLFLFERKNVAPSVKVLDFGISKNLATHGQEGTNLTDTGAFMGSPSYMSPEQMADGKSTDPRSDIWSIGVVLLELLTGRLPFEGTQVTELVVQVLHEPAPKVSALRKGLPREIDAIVDKCLAKKREDRYASIEELMDALRPLATRAASSDAAAVSLPFDRTVRAIPETVVEVPNEAPPAATTTGAWLRQRESVPPQPARKAGPIVMFSGFATLASLGLAAFALVGKGAGETRLPALGVVQTENKSEKAEEKKETQEPPQSEPASASASASASAFASASASASGSVAAARPVATSSPRVGALPSAGKPATTAGAAPAASTAKPVVRGFNE